MQVLLMLSTDLDGGDERDSAALDNLLMALVDEVQSDKEKNGPASPSERSSHREFQLVVLRLLSVSMSRYYEIYTFFSTVLIILLLGVYQVKIVAGQTAVFWRDGVQLCLPPNCWRPHQGWCHRPLSKHSQKLAALLEVQG